jgi:hypothetical protein
MELQTERIELTYKNTPHCPPLLRSQPSKAIDRAATDLDFAVHGQNRSMSGQWMSPWIRCKCLAAFVGVLWFTVFSLGCEKPEPIREYSISKAMPAALKASDRMLAAIIPEGDQVWFYKLTGPKDAIEFAEGDIRKFIAAVTFADGQPQIGELPNGWVQETEKRPMRFATVLINTPSKQLELAVSSLPKSGDWDEQVAMNVNRWRGQMKLADSLDRWAGATELQLDQPTDPPAVWVDLEGEMGAGPSMSPFAGGNMPAAVRPAGSTAAAGTTVAASAPNPEGGLKYDVPEGWRAGKMSMMRLAAFNIGPEDQSAELTIIQAGGDLRGNVDRWLGQVRGDSPPAEVVDAALEAAEQLTVSGRDARRYYLSDGKGDESAGQMIDATIIPMNNEVSMFIKATGPAKTLVQQREAIASFLKSLQIPE